MGWHDEWEQLKMFILFVWGEGVTLGWFLEISRKWLIALMSRHGESLSSALLWRQYIGDSLGSQGQGFPFDVIDCYDVNTWGSHWGHWVCWGHMLGISTRWLITMMTIPGGIPVIGIVMTTIHGGVPPGVRNVIYCYGVNSWGSPWGHWAHIVSALLWHQYMGESPGSGMWFIAMTSIPGGVPGVIECI